MTQQFSDVIAQVNGLTVDERIALVDEILLSIPPEQFKLTQAQMDELDRRIAEHEANPLEGQTWEEVEAELEGKG